MYLKSTRMALHFDNGEYGGLGFQKLVNHTPDVGINAPQMFVLLF